MSDSETSCTSPTPTSGKPTSTKRCNKPQMERKRRERINLSLNMLKQLVLEALKKDTSQYSKLEKADILEMTVKHLRDLQRQQLVSAASSDSSVVGKYRAGFTECASEVTRYLDSVDGLKPDIRNRLMHHLNGCVQRVHSPPAAEQQQTYAQAHYVTSASVAAAAASQQGASGSAVNVVPLPVSIHQQQQTTAIPATRPIQIQIPVATSPASLPGAGVQALQLAVTSGMVASGAADAGAAAASYHHQVQQQQQQRGTSPQQTPSPKPAASSPSAATYSPVNAPAYIGAFHVIPGGQTAFMLPQAGQINTATPVYALNTSPQGIQTGIQQAQQIQQMIFSQTQVMAAGTPNATVSSATVAPSVMSGKRRLEPDNNNNIRGDTCPPPTKKVMTHCPPPVCGVKTGVKLAINDTLREEKVWRPW